MRTWWLVPVALVPGAATRAGPQREAEEPLTVGTVRFYQPASGTTTIEGVCELRLSGIASGAAQGAGPVRYRLEVAVQDSTGLELLRSRWAREVPAEAARTSGATVVESFRFAAAPGRYRVRVRVVPAVGAPLEREVELRAYDVRPRISDLLLATAVRGVGADSAVGPGEVQRAGFAMRTAPVPRLSLTEASLTYYAEVYPWPGGVIHGQLSAEVLGAGGRSIIGTAPRALRIEAAGGLTRGTLNLTGLPPGDYRLRLGIRLGDSTMASEAPFTVSAAGSPVIVPMALVGDAPEDPFAAAGEERLDSLYAPLEYLASPEERNVYPRLTLEGKRRFLGEFWRHRDPTPGTADNPVMEQFYRSVQYANEAFREGGVGQVPGWRTDRGRIYLKNGRPDEALRRPLASPRPFEVWRYTRGRQQHYVFYDRSGFGHYVLLATNDRREAGLPNWEEYLGRENVEEIVRFLQQ